jgi:glycerol-3-phosphate dehydrogenase
MTASDQPFDLIVIGGGINGAGIACDASGRGLSVCLLEKNDLASATSSASSKLIHGGLRYLEQYEFRLVREALSEREVMLSKAPQIISPLCFVLPHHKQLRPAWMLRLGLFLYDHLAAHPRLPNSRRINLVRDPAGAPLVDTVRKGFTYWDCWVDDARLVVLNAMQASENGARIKTRTKVINASRINDLWQVDIVDGTSGAASSLFARVLLNAAGPWVGAVQDMAVTLKRTSDVLLVKGSHIVVPKMYDGDHAYILQNDDQRVIFVIPYEGKFSLIGTTDIPVEGDPGAAQISADEIDYLCQSVNSYFKKTVSAADVVWSYSGVRPLFDDAENDLSKVTREYVLEIDGDPGQAPMLSIFGGKITTYRRLAEHALERLQSYFPAMTSSWTATAPLPGGHMQDGDFAQFTDRIACEYPDLDPTYLRALAHRHGERIRDVLGGSQSMAELGGDFGGGLFACEVDYLIANEWALTAEDILWRRTKTGLHMSVAERNSLDRYLASKLAG